MSKQGSTSPVRRSFLTSMNAGVASLAALAVSGVARAQSKPAATSRFEPARHDKDDWYDQIPGKHRMVFDTTSFEGFTDAILFSNNFFRANKAAYGLSDSDLAVVIIARHRSTPFGYNDAMWTKYGKVMSARSKAEDPKTKGAPSVNMFNSTEHAALLSRGTTLDALAKMGIQFAVCGLATRAYGGAIAEATGQKADDVVKELSANLVGSARIVPAGIVAVNRAQEHRYTLVNVSA